MKNEKNRRKAVFALTYLQCLSNVRLPIEASEEKAMEQETQAHIAFLRLEHARCVLRREVWTTTIRSLSEAIAAGKRMIGASGVDPLPLGGSSIPAAAMSLAHTMLSRLSGRIVARLPESLLIFGVLSSDQADASRAFVARLQHLLVDAKKGAACAISDVKKVEKRLAQVGVPIPQA